jgi:hypothetical protein
LLDNGKITGVNLFIPGFQEGDADWGQIGYLSQGRRHAEPQRVYDPSGFQNQKQSQLRRAA